ncbi:platelet endothelial cell adhesion molecule isoform X2 [Electrophorus electricus]|uniref:platelet endothelial cell adhesion molecule isoform X2 n=1 Tax=Electrophorus electricus TaxID=8005 RepID=UPI0015D08331|nr:platelet endothelial cell adhesion molecule isoform X2 [Electrophorus electricus]
MQVLRQPSPTCLLLCLLLCVLAFLVTCTEVKSVIRSVTLSVDPAADVERGANLTLTCAVDAAHSGGVMPAYQYSFFKDYEKRELARPQPTDNVGRVVYSIPSARAIHSGKYQCKVVIDGQNWVSNFRDVVVRGLQAPVLTVDKTAVREGETVSITCRADGEMGKLTFSIKDGSDEVHRKETDSGHMQEIIPLRSARTASLTCSYFLAIGTKTLQSNVSNVLSVAVHELDITPSVTVHPQTGVIEGDTVNITCSVNPHYQDLSSLSLNLMKGPKILDMKNATYSKCVLASDSGEYECSAELDGVRKSGSVNLTVRELFSQPTVTVTPTDVFEGQDFTVHCRSLDFASERIRRDDVKYSILRNEDNVTLGRFDGTYRAMAGTKTNGNYTCSAQVRTIVKRSTSVSFEAKVLVSRPVITVDERVVLGRPFNIYCYSENGSLPINYTLIWKRTVLNHSILTHTRQQAQFTATVHSEADVHSLACGAQNYDRKQPLMSSTLKASVTVPAQKAFLTVVPTPEDIVEGHDIYLICSIMRGTPPFTIKWYRQDDRGLLYTNTVSTNSSSHTLVGVHNENSGTYYCDVQNYGSDRALSNKVSFTVNMARWKKALIIGACLLALAVVVVVVLIRYRAKRGKRETAVKLSVSREQRQQSRHVEQEASRSSTLQ